MRGEEGFAAVEFILGMGFVVLACAGLLVVTNWPSEIHAVNAAAYEAARAVVEAPTPDEGAATGRQRAREVMDNHGFASTPVDVSYTAAGRGEALTATVRVVLPALRFPLAGEWDAVSYSRSSTQRVGDYRGYG